MSTETTADAEQATSSQLLDEVLANSHPLMVEGFFLAAVPFWYDVPLFTAMRQRPDNRDEGIIERLRQYSFIVTLEEPLRSGQAFTVHPVQRALLNERWIARDPTAYREAHRRALTYWEAHPESDPDADARNLLYHRLFVDAPEATEYLIGLFRVYSADRKLAVIERMLVTVSEARGYLLLLGDALPAGFDDLLLHLKTRLGQLRGRWEESLAPLEQLRGKPDLPPRLLPYVIRAHADALAEAGDYVGAVKDYEQALALFDRQAKQGMDPENIEAERGYTLIALGDAYMGLAHAARGRAEEAPGGSSDSLPRTAVRFALALPLAIYLSNRLGRQVWHPRHWGLVSDLDWIIARLIATGAAYYRRADPILEAHGRPSEGVVADQKLADLYLELGDPYHAEGLYEGLLGEESGPLSDYGRATALLGLGGALLAQARPEEALPRLEAALPLLRRFEDASGEALAELAQADALRDLSRPVDALPHYEAALRLYGQQEDHVGATRVGERLEPLASDERMPADVRAAAAQSYAAITPRHYPVRYRNPAIVAFQRAIVVLLALVIFMTPILAIHLVTGTAFEPAIAFRAGPLLDNSADFQPDLSQTVQALKLAPPPETDVLLWAAALLLLVYLALSALLGLLAIILTPLSSVQATTYADSIRLDEGSIRTGEGSSRLEIAWSDAQELVRADVLLWRDRVRNESRAAVAAARDRIIISGQTVCYESLLQHIDRLAPPQVRRADVSFSVLRSPMGALYLLTLVLLILISILSTLQKNPLFANLAGTAYSLADLYPYFYLGLFLPPMVWFVVQPLRQRRRIDPTDMRLALILGGIGLGLAALRILARFRPWLTVPDIYPALAAIILIGSAAITLVRAPRAPGDRAAVVVRGLVAAAAALVILVMGAQLWREAAAYHYLVRANDLSDQALSEDLADDPEARDATLQRAADTYARAQTIADTTLLGIPGRAVLRGGPGLPPDAKLTWFDATSSYAAMLSELLRDTKEILPYYDLLVRETQDPEAYSGRALAALRAATFSPTGELSVASELDREAYLSAIRDLSDAIDREQDNEKYYLWRGFALHALGSTDLAAADYVRALRVPPEEGGLDPADRATALTGLGWVDFSRRLQTKDSEDRKRLAQSAEERFWQAVKWDQKSPDAWLGLGYARYSQRKYDEALSAWKQTESLRRDDAAVQLSLGALYWRMGTLLEGYVDDNGKDKPGLEYCGGEYPADQRATAQERLQRAVAYWTHALELADLKENEKATTYSSLGQIYFLMRYCPDEDAAEMLKRALEAGDKAIELDPENAIWPYRSGRLAHNLFQVLRDRATGPNPEAAGWALRAMQHYDRSIELSTDQRGLEIRRNDKRARIVAARDYALAGLREGQRALEAGEIERAKAWFDVGLPLAKRSELSPLAIYGELAPLRDWLAAHPEAEADPLRQVRRAALEGPPTQEPFLQGLLALEENRISDAAESYQQGAEEALAQGDLATVGNAAIALRYAPGGGVGPVLDAMRDALPRVEELAGSQELATSVDAAVRTAVLAAALEDHPTAGRWLNEASRRVGQNRGQYSSAFVPARDYLKALWAASGSVASEPLLAEMDRQLDALLAESPDTVNDGFFWRYRAWLKYHLGRSAFRLGDAMAARDFLDSGIQDSARAVAISEKDHRSVPAYLNESAWGWFHVERGDDATMRGDLTSALADYQFAYNLIRPKESLDARKEKSEAAFRAGYTALKSGQPERAVQWYQQGVAAVGDWYQHTATPAERRDLRRWLVDEIAKLVTLLGGTDNPSFVAAGTDILESLRTTLDRVVIQ